MKTVSDYFGCLVFDDRVMKATLSDKVYGSLKKTIDEGVSLDNNVANAVATAMKVGPLQTAPPISPIGSSR